MPNHWESSARPLFVKTVFINGNRHAILSQEDPLLQPGNSSFKKQSRPNSSLTITSSFSVDSKNDHEFISENKRKFSGSEYSRQKLAKNLSSDLQDCLINLRLVPNHQDNEKPPKSDRPSCEGPEEKKLCEVHEKNFFKTGEKKGWSRSKTAQNYGRKSRQDAFAKNEFSGFKKSTNDYCFANNLENRTKKNNSISSKFSQTWGETYDLTDTYESNHIIEKNPLYCKDLISADRIEKADESSCNDFYCCSNLDPCELYWNNYLISKAINSSLTERVIQWLDLTHKKRKKPNGNIKGIIDKICASSVDNIFGSSFFEKGSPEKTNSKSFKNQQKLTEKKEKGSTARKEKSDEDVMSEVKCELNVSTILSDEKSDAQRSQNAEKSLAGLENISHQIPSGEIKTETKKRELKSQLTMIAAKIDPEISKSVALEESILKTFVNVQELVFNGSPFENFQSESLVEFHDSKKYKKRQFYSSRQSKSLNYAEDNEKSKMERCQGKSTKNGWATEAIESWDELLELKIEKNSADQFKWGTLKDDCQVLDKNMRTSNNLDKTQNVSRQFSPKENLQQDILWLRGSKNAWHAVKDIKRPQLHIFMPLIFSKESSEDCVSECDRCITEL